MTYKEYSNFPLTQSEMAPCPLALYIYVATTAAGIFFTDDFVDETGQPTWVDITGVLSTAACKEFHIDPSDPYGRQYVLLWDNTLWRRVNQGAWEEILDLTDAAALCGCSATDSMFGGFCLNATIPGKIWVTFGSASVVEEPDGYYILYSNDYGDNWSESWRYHGIFTYGLGSPVAYDDYIFIPMSVGAGGSEMIYYSSNGGVGWDHVHLGPNYVAPISYNILIPNRVYAYAANPGATGLHQYDIVAGTAFLQALTHLRGDGMWFDPVDPDTQRLFDYFGNRLNYTTDNWTNYSATNTNLDPYAFNPIDINGEIICAIKLDHAAHQHHCIAVLTDVTDVNPVGIAGTNCDTAPFTDSIPDTCGEVCLHGIQAFWS